MDALVVFEHGGMGVTKPLHFAVERNKSACAYEPKCKNLACQRLCRTTRRQTQQENNRVEQIKYNNEVLFCISSMNRISTLQLRAEIQVPRPESPPSLFTPLATGLCEH